MTFATVLRWQQNCWWLVDRGWRSWGCSSWERRCRRGSQELRRRSLLPWVRLGFFVPWSRSFCWGRARWILSLVSGVRMWIVGNVVDRAFLFGKSCCSGSSWKLRLEIEYWGLVWNSIIFNRKLFWNALRQIRYTEQCYRDNQTWRGNPTHLHFSYVCSQIYFTNHATIFTFFQPQCRTRIFATTAHLKHKQQIHFKF